MKIQIDLPNAQLWNDFKTKVQGDGKTLREVVPTVFEPALKAYLEPTTITPPPEPSDAPQVKPTPPAPISVPTVKRCDLCDMPIPRTFNYKGKKVCYSCWRDGIINEGTAPQPTQ